MTEPQDPFAPPGDQPPAPPPATYPPPPAYGAPPPGYGPPPPGYGAPPPGYGGPVPYPPPYGAQFAAGQKTNTLAIVGFILSFPIVCPLIGLVLCIVALTQIKKTGEGGRGLAIAGIVISGLLIVGFVSLFSFGTFVSSSFHDSCTYTGSDGVTTSC